MERNEIGTIADGHADDGSFVRTFWDWDDSERDVLHVRARIKGADHATTMSMAQLQELLDKAPGRSNVVVANINGQTVYIPWLYLTLIPSQIAWLDGGQAGPCPGSSEE